MEQFSVFPLRFVYFVDGLFLLFYITTWICCDTVKPNKTQKLLCVFSYTFNNSSNTTCFSFLYPFVIDVLKLNMS